MKKQKICAMIPARAGSTRLKMKNLALIDGKPLISYVINAVKQSGIFDNIVINSENIIFKSIADRYGVEFYKRPEYLGSSTTKSDDVVLNFVQNYTSDIVVWANPISPLQTGEEIRNVVQYFQKENLDSLITLIDEQVHCIYKGNPVNFDQAGKFAQTQELESVQQFVYSIMMWRVETFVDAMNRQGHAFFSGKVGYYPVSKWSSIIVKTDQDFKLASYALKAIMKEDSCIEYDDLAKPYLK
jgi:CMP-N-acetylneuraminic acid synthetase